MLTREQAVRNEIRYAVGAGMLSHLVQAYPNISLSWLARVAEGEPLDEVQVDLLWNALNLDESSLEPLGEDAEA